MKLALTLLSLLPPRSGDMPAGEGFVIHAGRFSTSSQFGTLGVAAAAKGKFRRGGRRGPTFLMKYVGMREREREREMEAAKAFNPGWLGP